MKIKITSIFISIIVILIPIIIFSFFIHKTRSIPKVEIILKVEEDINNNNYNLSKESIENLQNVMKEFNYSVNTDKLIQVFEREREHYIVIVTIITLIITIFSLFMILNRFVEKDEYDKIVNEFEKQKKEFDVELNELKISNLIFKIKSGNDGLKELVNLVYNDGYVQNLDQFEIFIEKRILSYTKVMDKLRLSNENIDNIIIRFRNMIIFIIRYAYNKKWINTKICDVNKNILFKNLIKLIKSNIDNNLYIVFKERLLKSAKNKNNVNFGEY